MGQRRHLPNPSSPGGFPPMSSQRTKVLSQIPRAHFLPFQHPAPGSLLGKVSFSDLWPMHGPLGFVQYSHRTGLLNFYANPMPWKTIFPCSPMAGTVPAQRKTHRHSADHNGREGSKRPCVCMQLRAQTLGQTSWVCAQWFCDLSQAS